jgi:uncharacterized protein YaiE (UPF0345 family)
MVRMRSRRIWALAFAVAILAWPAAAQATTITVTSTADNLAGCTLRNAIKAANTNAAAGTCPTGQPSPTVDRINFSVPSGSTILLTGPLDPIAGDVNIVGPGRTQLTVSGADAYQPFKINAGTTASISGLTISHGMCDSSCGFDGGAIRNDGTLTLYGVRVTRSSAAFDGGGISNGGTMTIASSVVSANTVSVSGGTNSSPEGGGIFNEGTMNIVLSTITGNSATGTGATNQSGASGGGIHNSGTGELTIDRSTISSNDATADAMGGSATNAHGGAINNRHNLTITRSTVSGNTVSGTGGASSNSAVGGGISNINPAVPADVTVTLDRTTLSDNTASGPPSSTQAGGMQILPGTYTIKSSTIAHNSAGFGANLTGGTPTFTNTIVSNPEGGGTNCTGAPSATSYDISSDGTCGFTGTGDHLNTDPLLAAGLANNGGPTQTYALQSGSPAIDQGKASFGETVDQRGESRPSDLSTKANAAGGDGSDIGAFEVQAPDTNITSGPAAGSLITDRTPTFRFTGNEPGLTFRCRVDSASFAACTSPRTIGSLANGTHTFSVRAVDTANNVDLTPASRTFTVDATPPNTSITSGPANGSLIKDRTPTFGFSSTETGSHFQCKVDSASFAACTRPRTIGPLADGTHTFSVRAIDKAGNVDATAASRSFTVDATPPNTSIASGPANGSLIKDRTPTFGFSSTEPGSHFKCKIDGGSFGARTNPRTVGSLANGTHTFSVRAIDKAGNADPTPASRSFKVDATAPDTTITKHPRGRTHKRRPRFRFESSQANSSFECKLDRKHFKPCTSPFKPKHKLDFGRHKFKVRATDPAGNTDQTAAKFRFKVTRRH